MDVFIISQMNITMLFVNLISMLKIKYSILKTDTHGLHTNIVYILQQIMFLIWIYFFEFIPVSVL